MADHEFSDEALESAYNRLMDHADGHSNPDKAETLRFAAAVVLFDHTNASEVAMRRILSQSPK